MPQLLQPAQTPVRLIADQNGGVDGADRNTRDPVGPKAGLLEGLIGTDVVGAQRPTALENQNDLRLRRGRLFRVLEAHFVALPVTRREQSTSQELTIGVCPGRCGS